jgi:hypothetical protein
MSKIMRVETISRRLAGRPNIDCENKINEDLRIVKLNYWTKFIQDWVKWKEVVEKDKTFKP